MNGSTKSPERCWDHLYVPEADMLAYWERRTVALWLERARSERRYAIGRHVVWVLAIMLVGFAAYRIVGGLG